MCPACSAFADCNTSYESVSLPRKTLLYWFLKSWRSRKWTMKNFRKSKLGQMNCIHVEFIWKKMDPNIILRFWRLLLYSRHHALVNTDIFSEESSLIKPVRKKSKCRSLSPDFLFCIHCKLLRTCLTQRKWICSVNNEQNTVFLISENGSFNTFTLFNSSVLWITFNPRYTNNKQQILLI